MYPRNARYVCDVPTQRAVRVAPYNSGTFHWVDLGTGYTYIHLSVCLPAPCALLHIWEVRSLSYGTTSYKTEPSRARRAEPSRAGRAEPSRAEPAAPSRAARAEPSRPRAEPSRKRV